MKKILLILSLFLVVAVSYSQDLKIDTTFKIINNQKAKTNFKYLTDNLSGKTNYIIKNVNKQSNIIEYSTFFKYVSDSTIQSKSLTKIYRDQTNAMINYNVSIHLVGNDSINIKFYHFNHIPINTFNGISLDVIQSVLKNNTLIDNEWFNKIYPEIIIKIKKETNSRISEIYELLK